MTFFVRPISRLQGVLKLPPSKSYSIRAVIISALGGASTLFNLSLCDDAKVALRIARKIGAKVTEKSRTTFFVQGKFKFFKRPFYINVGESGTVLRFLLPLLALQNTKGKITGEGTLRSRPNEDLLKSLRAMGCIVQGRGKKESVPIYFQEGVLSGGQSVIKGSLSSQFISALLIASPLLEEKTHLRIGGRKIVSQTYITMTLQVLRKAGIRIKTLSQRLFDIPGNQSYKGLKKFIVPSDYGLAAFAMSAGILTDSQLRLKGYFDDRLIQADGKILIFLKEMGAIFRKTKKEIIIKGPCVLRGGSFSLKDCPDLVPIMAVLALFAEKKTRLYNIGHARIKESDRISDLRKELLKIGARITEKKDELIIYPQKSYRSNCLLDPHKDHRLAMAFTVLGLKVGVKIKDMECTAKSYPDFIKDFRKAGVKFQKV